MLELAAVIKGVLPEYLRFWKTICNMETPSSDKKALNLQADYIEQFCKEKGFSVSRQSYELAGDTMVIELCGEIDKAPVVLLAHMDTVHKIGAFGYPPVQERDGILFGPGVFDCKGGIAVSLLAMEAIAKSSKKHRSIKLILNSDEEDGRFIGDEGVRFIQETSRGACAAFNAEAGREDSLTVGRKGIIKAEMQIHGIGGHAGNAYYECASAIREAAYKIIELEAQSKGDITYNCGIVNGGTAVNVVAECCTIGVDIRFKNAQQQNNALEVLERVAHTTFVDGCVTKLQIDHIRPAMECTKGNLELFEKVADIARSLGMGELEAKERGGGSDSAYTVAVGIPTVCSMGTVGRYEHSVREEADISTLESRAILMAKSILNCFKGA